MKLFNGVSTIIFDLEGVVVDTEKLWDEAAVIFLARRNITYVRETTKHLMMGKNLAEGVSIMQEIYGFDGDLHELAQERREISKKLFATKIDFTEGFLDFYDKIKRKFKLAVATGLERHFLGDVERHVNLSKLFGKHIYSISDIDHISKPNPDIFLLAAKKIKTEPSACLVIEDSPNGIEAARRAGMRSIGITTTTDKKRLSGATLVVNSFTEIPLF